MSWNLEGQTVAGVYNNSYTVVGVVTLSRVKYGGKVQHTVELATPVEIYGTVRTHLLMEQESKITRSLLKTSFALSAKLLRLTLGRKILGL